MQAMPYAALQQAVAEWWQGVGAEIDERLAALFSRQFEVGEEEL
jgi:hypothetical protein